MRISTEENVYVWCKKWKDFSFFFAYMITAFGLLKFLKAYFESLPFPVCELERKKY